MNQTAHPHDLTLHLSELFENLTAFHAILKNEALLLKQHELNQLVDLLPKKQTQSDKINDLVQQVETLFNLPSNLNDLLIRITEQNYPQSLQKNLVNIIDLAESCRDLNMRNGITIQALDNINAQLTNLFTDNSATPVSLYTASGTKKHSSSKATLGKA